MKSAILILLFASVLSPLSAKIGWTLDQCIKEYGKVIQKYGDDDTSLPEYEFLVGQTDVTVIMMNGKVAQVTISPKNPFGKNQIRDALNFYSEYSDWEMRPYTDSSVSGKISGFLPSDTDEYFISPKSGLLAMVKKDWVGSRPFFVKITIPEHKDGLIEYRKSRK